MFFKHRWVIREIQDTYDLEFRMQNLKLIPLIIFLQFGSSSAFGFCDDPRDISLRTYEFSERLLKSKISLEGFKTRLEASRLDFQLAEWELEGVQSLFQNGHINISDYEMFKLTIDLKDLAIKESESQLQAMISNLEISRRNVEDSCGEDNLDPAEIIKFANMFKTQWNQQIENDLPGIALYEKTLELQLGFLDHHTELFAKGYISLITFKKTQQTIKNSQGTLALRRKKIVSKREYIVKLENIIAALENL
jgi:hypothetical protein